MPLKKSKSKEAFKANVKAEIASGKAPRQAVAIAYSVARKAGKSGGHNLRSLKSPKGGRR